MEPGERRPGRLSAPEDEPPAQPPDDEADDELEILRISHEIETQQRERVEQVRAGRDDGATRAALEELKRAAEADDVNLVPVIMDAVRAEATVGEISKALQDVWGHYSEPARL
ncbi:MAG: hypothetical protein KY437_10775 [Actinobacteria bacterium]|nr:hypothetical protein [Actinomycetota bacterium]